MERSAPSLSYLLEQSIEYLEAVRRQLQIEFVQCHRLVRLERRLEHRFEGQVDLVFGPRDPLLLRVRDLCRDVSTCIQIPQVKLLQHHIPWKDLSESRETTRRQH